MIKISGQVFTPEWIVQKMLDLLQFNSIKVLNLKIIDNSCGDGAFLKEIINRMIDVGLKNNYSKVDIAKTIEKNVFGIELDKTAFYKCLKNLESIRIKNNLPVIKWKIFSENTLLVYKRFINKFDIVVGNPPYVRIHNTVENLKEFSFCKNGMSDLYIAFYEIGLEMLNQNGKLCYINPSSLFNSKAALKLRNHIIEKKLLSQVIDFRHQQIFDNITTYSCIVLLDKTNEKKQILFSTNIKEFLNLNYDDILIENSWYFNQSIKNLRMLKRILNYSKQNYVVKNGLATLCDKIFINKFYENVKSKYILDVIKASTLVEQKILFPYDENFNPVAFSDLEPDIQIFLSNNKETLLNRDLENKQKWWLFGRTQAIKDKNKLKVSINTTIKNTSSIKTKIVTENTMIYSGLYVIVNNEKEALKIQTLVKTQNFINYISLLSKYKAGGYYTFNSTDLTKFINFYMNHNL